MEKLTEILLIKLPPSMKADLRHYSGLRHTTMSSVVKQLIDGWLEKQRRIEKETKR